MPAKIAAPKGFEDILPGDSWKWQAVERIARETAELYHFREIRTPVMEHSELFHRGVGETTDIVHKETFTFTDRGGDSMTLRPEGTAGVVRAAIEHGLIGQEGARAKLYYIAPNFRYERPQKGRLRQHHQFGAEALGVADPAQDVECILLQLDFYEACGLQRLGLQINSLGDRESKQRFREALTAHLAPKASRLSEDSQRRLTENPLRILDSKDARDQEACQDAPSPLDCLSPRSRDHFERVQVLLRKSGRIPPVAPKPTEGMDDAYDRVANKVLPAVLFDTNPRLVRGFDYYTDTLWEVTAEGLGSQNAVGGGGRYDNLVEMLGGKPAPGVGFGSGLERLLIALEAQGLKLPHRWQPLHYLVYYGERAREEMWMLLRQLRIEGFRADMDLSDRSPKAQFKRANDEEAARVLIVGDNEIEAKTVVVKDYATGEQTAVPRAELIPHLQRLATPK